MRELNISEIREMNLTFQRGIQTRHDKIRNSQESADIFRKIIGDDINVRECVVVLAVSRDLKVSGYYFLSKGGIAASVVDHLLFLKLAVVSNAASFIIAHNHPSGNIQPSEADLKLTKELIQKSKGVVSILDHLIVTENSYYSMRDEGTIRGFAPKNFDYLEIPKTMPQLIEDTNFKTNQTMITISNITTEYPKINQNSLPAPLKKGEFEFIKENLDLYKEDKDIKEYIDTFVSKLNELAAKSDTKKNATVRKKTPVKTAATKSNGNTKTKKRASSKKKSNTKPSLQTKAVGNVDLQVSLIKSFVLSHNKPKTKQQILNLYKRIEKAATELKIRKTSKYADEIKYVAKTLQTAYNNKKGGSDEILKIKIPENRFENLYKIAYSEKQRLSVQYIKRYIGMYGANDMYERADRLSASINNALKKKKITSKDLYYERIKTIQKVLTGFVTKEDAVLYPEMVNLKGLAGIAGVALPKKKSPEVSKSLSGIDNSLIPSSKANSTGLPDGIVNSEDLKNMQFDNIEFSGDWKELIGNPSKPFHIMIYGMPGSGKSTQSVNFVKYTANNHNFKVLYLAKEEGVSNTVKEKFKRLNAFHPNIFITADMPDDLSYFDLLVIDSVNEMNMTPDDIRSIQETYPNLSTWQIFKATKEGKFLGLSDFGHLCQTELVCSEGYCQAQKNRFGGNGKVGIKY